MQPEATEDGSGGRSGRSTGTGWTEHELPHYATTHPVKPTAAGLQALLSRFTCRSRTDGFALISCCCVTVPCNAVSEDVRRPAMHSESELGCKFCVRSYTSREKPFLMDGLHVPSSSSLLFFPLEMIVYFTFGRMDGVHERRLPPAGNGRPAEGRV
jgi:hypothetical protein